jgi:hypothetical protein
MAESSTGGGMGVGLILGALVVVVAIIGAVVFAGGYVGGSKSVDVNIKTPTLSAPSAPTSQ